MTGNGYIVHQCDCGKSNVMRKICTVGERLRKDQYHYDLEWLCQCDECKKVDTFWV